MHTMDYGCPVRKFTFDARPKINSQSQIFRYGRSIFCLSHRPKFSDFFDLCLHWVSVVRGFRSINLAGQVDLLTSKKILMGVAILEGDRTCPRAPRVKCYYPHSPWWLDSLFSPRYLDAIGIGASLFIHISQLSYTMTTNSISSRLAKAKQIFLEVILF